jgi:hypothetical protein
VSDKTIKASAFWRRLDTPGTDVARLFQTPTGWQLTGTAVFLHETTRSPARLDYGIELARDWTTIRGTIVGFVGRSTVEQTIVRDHSGWSVNGESVRDRTLQSVEDLDLGFTPATNFAQLQRAHLGVGQAADFSVAWWDAGEPMLVALPQHYERRSEWRYWYVSPDSSYEAELELSPTGFVRHYPRLWMLESE